MRKKIPPLYFDAPQLIKHSIGLINQNRLASIKRKITLFCLYWVPTNYDEFLANPNHPYAIHKEQLDDFTKQINQGNNAEITFKALTYSELWEKFDKEVFGNAPPDIQNEMKAYYAGVKDRYRFAVPCK
ncbi:hypothetical protein FACS18942_05500 [Planctomycetales bacterium]|nr:hypothetical protein FACS18942_05500 [Planctomycetales bacterium]GHT35411.1 hypothetical protein FACS189427_04610 [Planctomycetales bacterium]